MVEGIVGSATADDAIAGTRKALELSGVVITDDPVARHGSAAWMYLSTQQLQAVAFEAQQRASLTRATFREFAETVAGAAGLPPVAGAPFTTTTPTDSVRVTISDQAVRLGGFVTDWVNFSEKNHSSSDPVERSLTNAPLLVAALAQHQIDPVDLHVRFMPDDLRLGTLDLLLLIAGMRASLLAARKGGPPQPELAPSPTIAPSPTTAPSPAPGASLSPTIGPRATPTAGPSRSELSPGRRGLAAVSPAFDCQQVAADLSSVIPGLGELSTFAFGESLKGQIAEFAEHTTNIKGVGEKIAVLFEVFGMIARLHALLLLYTNVEVKTEVTPDTIHKGTDATTTVTAKVTAGIPDATWAKFKNEQAQTSPLMAAARSCLQALGIPTAPNLGDIGDAMKNWHAAWDIVEGSPAHANLPGSQFLGPGAAASRLERPMQPQGDHKATDSIDVNILPEKATDHPGTLTEAWAVVCSAVRTDPPPDLKTLLNPALSGNGAGDFPIAGEAEKVAEAGGKLFGPAAIASLTATIVDLLAGWYQNVQTLDSCGRVKITYHLPKQKWSGTVTVKSVKSSNDQTAMEGSTSYPAKGGGKLTINYSKKSGISTTIRVGEEYRVTGQTDTGLPPGQASPIELLDADQLTYGFNEFITWQRSDGPTGSSCVVRSASLSWYSGTFSYNGKAHMTVTLAADGKYSVIFDADRTAGANATISGNTELASLPTGDLVGSIGGMELRPPGNCKTTTISHADTRPAVMVGAAGAKLEGQLNPADPGNKLVGSTTVTSSDGTTTTITWDLRHEGPIQLPSR